MTGNKRKPAIFRPEDSRVKITPQPDEQLSENAITPYTGSTDNGLPPQMPKAKTSVSARIISWGALLFGSLAGLAGLWAASAIIINLKALIARQDMLGWVATTLAITALLSLFVLIIREIVAIARLKKLGALRATGQQLHDENKMKPARKYLRDVKQLYSAMPNRRWNMARLGAKEKEIMDGREIIELLDEEIGKPLDSEARLVISNTARKVSVITAIAPGPVLDMVAVTILNIGMIRKIAEVYGVRPGFFGQLRLARNVIAHLALSGGIAVTSDLLSPIIGTSIAAKLSKRLGEGLFNGALTIRIGLSAIELTRPIPYVKTKRLSFAKLVTSSLNVKPDSKSAQSAT